MEAFERQLEKDMARHQVKNIVRFVLPEERTIIQAIPVHRGFILLFWCPDAVHIIKITE